MGRTRKRTAAHSIPSEDGFDHGDGCVVVGKCPRSKPAQHDPPQGTIGYRSCAQLLVDARSRLDGQTPALRAANPTRKQHRGVEPDRCAVSTSPRTSKGQLLYSIGKPQATFIFSFFTGGRLGPLGAPEPLSPRPCPLRCSGAFPEGARLARVASSPPQRPFQRNWQLTLGGFLSMYHHGTPQDTAKL